MGTPVIAASLTTTSPVAALLDTREVVDVAVVGLVGVEGSTGELADEVALAVAAQQVERRTGVTWEGRDESGDVLGLFVDTVDRAAGQPGGVALLAGDAPDHALVDTQWGAEGRAHRTAVDRAGRSTSWLVDWVDPVQADNVVLHLDVWFEAEVAEVVDEVTAGVLVALDDMPAGADVRSICNDLALVADLRDVAGNAVTCGDGVVDVLLADHVGHRAGVDGAVGALDPEAGATADNAGLVEVQSVEPRLRAAEGAPPGASAGTTGAPRAAGKAGSARATGFAAGCRSDGLAGAQRKAGGGQDGGRCCCEPLHHVLQM